MTPFKSSTKTQASGISWELRHPGGLIPGAQSDTAKMNEIPVASLSGASRAAVMRSLSRRDAGAPKSYTVIQATHYLTAASILLLAPTAVRADVPLTFNYQGKAFTPTGAPLSGNQTMWFKILHKTTPTDAGTVVYAETAEVVLSPDGIVNHAVGTGTPAAGQTLEVADYNAPAGTTIHLSVAGGVEENVLLPHTQIHAVPVAVLATTITTNSLKLDSLAAGTIRASSPVADSIAGYSTTANHSGITGIGTNGGVGIYGRSDTGRAGAFDGPIYATSIQSPEIRSESTNNDAIGGYTSAVNHAGVVGIGTNGAVGIYARSDFRAGSFDGPVFVSDLLSAKTIEVRGADVAEGFDQTDGSSAEPGTVMVIDEANPGDVKPSATAYDCKVAGIISGAGGVRPGLKLTQDGVADGNNLIAMAGRVYAKVSAENGPVTPGDLLTTADTPGHAMKASDKEISHGAVIGKAMTELKEGTGLVLVLVNLQ